jgi:iron complex transport system substrate-binding protein
MRIVSLIASSTEIACALGAERELVGRSHECDFPPSVTRLPQLTEPKFATDGSSAQIDERVRELLRSALSVYRVDADALAALRPDVILTQTQCEVCAVSLKDVEAAACNLLPSRPAIVSLHTEVLADLWRDIRRVARALDRVERGEALVAELQARMERLAESARELPRRRVACIEWLDPLMYAANWMPDLVAMAAGEMVKLDEKPDLIITMPCGFDIARTRADLPPSLQHGVFVTDGNQYFNRPGPRLVESLEILAEILHPERFRFGHEGTGWIRVE